MSTGPSMAGARVSGALLAYGADSPEYRAERFMWMHPAQRLPRELARELDRSTAARRSERDADPGHPARTRGSR
jgi:hypothetical protein